MTDGGRFFVSAVEWDTSDFTVPFLSGSRRSRAFFERLFVRNETRFIFLVHFTIDVDFESLVGEIAIVPHQLWNMHQVELLGRLHATSEVAANGSSRQLGTLSELPGAICLSHFMIQRNGECEIDIDEVHEDASRTLSEGGSDPDESLACFAYSFIRELFHTHKYHAPDSDTIITAYRGDWKSKVCASLLRKVIVLRKLGDLDNLRSAMGVLAYAEAFMSHVMKAGDKLWSPDSIATLREGLKTDIARAQAQSRVSLPRRVSGWSRLLAAALVALVGYLRINFDLSASVFSEKSALVAGLNMKEIMDSTMTKNFLIDFYLRYTDEFIILAVVLFVLSNLLSWEIGYFKSAARDMLRLAVVHRSAVTTITTLMAILCFALAVYFVVDAL